VAWHYAQNLMFFVNDQQIANYPALQPTQKDPAAIVPRLIHPDRYLLTAQVSNFAFRDVLRALPGFICRFFRWHWQHRFGAGTPAGPSK
jgi:hypothetical protein